MSRMLKTLYDEGKRERVREGIAKGNLAEALRRRGPGAFRDADSVMEVDERDIVLLDEAPTQETALPQPPPLPAEQDSPSRKVQCGSGVVAFDRQHGPRPFDQALFDAIQAGDLAAVRAAIAQGADIHSKHMYVPRHKRGDCIVSGRMTPLEYAIKKGRADIVAELRQQGAKA